uniref:Uncharacterized protein n=1 Tax=Salix viminalis TaxID=40686 RepID=A0A6N2NIE1_SALVM
MSKNLVRENVPLSRFGVLVAQLESIGASASQQSPDPLLSFDLLSDLLSAIDEEPQNLSCYGKENARMHCIHCSSLARGGQYGIWHQWQWLRSYLEGIVFRYTPERVVSKGFFLMLREANLKELPLWAVLSRDAEGSPRHFRQGEAPMPLLASGAVRCLGELYQHSGRKITSGLPETTIIASKLMKFHEAMSFKLKAAAKRLALFHLENNGLSALKLLNAQGRKDFVRQEALVMLEKALEGSGGSAASTAYTEAFRLITRIAIGDKSFALGPCLGVGEIENSASYCVKAVGLEDPVLLVRDAFSEALGSLLALGMNPEAQVQPRGKGPFPPAKKLEDGLQRHLALPFTKVLTDWSDTLASDNKAIACILYILRVSVTDQMTEPTQGGFLVFLGKQLESSDVTPSMKIAALRTLSYTLKTLGEVPLEFKELFDSTMFSVSHSSQLAALALHVLAEVDPTCVGGSNLKIELDSLNGQTTVLAALVSISPKLPLGYPARLPRSVLELSKKMLTESSRNPVAAIAEKEAGWLLLSSLLSSMPKQELEDQVFDILSLWATLFSGF